VNDVVIHPNQGELVSCDQAGSVKVWDLGENGCSHELVSAATWRREWCKRAIDCGALAEQRCSCPTQCFHFADSCQERASPVRAVA
jgi:hypothetical protein